MTIVDVFLLWAAMSLSACGLVGLAAYRLSYETESHLHEGNAPD